MAEVCPRHEHWSHEHSLQIIDASAGRFSFSGETDRHVTREIVNSSCYFFISALYLRSALVDLTGSRACRCLLAALSYAQRVLVMTFACEEPSSSDATICVRMHECILDHVMRTPTKWTINTVSSAQSAPFCHQSSYSGQCD